MAHSQIVFQVSGKRYSLPAQTVMEIKGSVSTTPLPEAPEFVRGVTYYRGKLIPVVSLKLKWGGVTTDSKEGYCLIVKGEGNLLAIEVDRVEGVSEGMVQNEISPLDLSHLFL